MEASTAVLVPVKAFARSKERLADALSPDARLDLVRSMATTVVRAADPFPVWVVCDDDEVATWARSVGARVVWEPGRGLNAAVAAGVAHVAANGATRVVVTHADLPRATSFATVAAFDGVTLVPDRRDDGTNVICLPVPAAAHFPFGYGAGSFARHRAAAAGTGVAVRLVRDAALAWDVDTAADLDWSVVA